MISLNEDKSSQYSRFPFVEIKETGCEIISGWPAICSRLNSAVKEIQGSKKVVVIETYHGVLNEELLDGLEENMLYNILYRSSDFMLPADEIASIVFPDVTDDRVFGRMTKLKIEDFFDAEKLSVCKAEIEKRTEGTIIIYGTGASLFCSVPDILVYADMARWEIQLRMRKHLVDNLGLQNRNTEDWMLLYKQAYFVDWRVCDELKKSVFPKLDFLLDTNSEGNPKLIDGKSLLGTLESLVYQPFSVVPFFDPGPWGGQWMKEVCNLDKSAPNFAWCFNCVPEENSLLLKSGNEIVEIPSIDLVFLHPEKLLGEDIYNRFGAEFPIRFDFLDTIGGGNLSLQVHPTDSYIKENFGMPYTQDESYYILDCEEDSSVFLGLKEGIDPEEMITSLESANAGKSDFDAERFVNTWPAKKHDHFLIPAGTVHCSGKDSLVLEISATPYIFTFKLWDWGRLGMDGRPRPVNVSRGKDVIQWNRTTSWTKENLVNRVKDISSGKGWKEERTGLHELEFIETRRHWFTEPVLHNTNGGVNVLCLVEGDEVVVESPSGKFDPFTVHYAEVFIVPANVGEYSIRPCGASAGKESATIKAFVV
jgi:mannose-6-phosphate isomerase class I